MIKQLLFQLVAFKTYAIKKLLFQLVIININWKQSLRVVPWNQLKSENIETLYLLSTWKESVQIDNKKACCYNTNKHEYQHSSDMLVKNVLNPISLLILNLFSIFNYIIQFFCCIIYNIYCTKKINYFVYVMYLFNLFQKCINVS